MPADGQSEGRSTEAASRYSDFRKAGATLDSRIVRLCWSFAGFLAPLLGTLAFLIAVMLKFGLKPLDELAIQVRGLDAESLDRRVDVASPPQELAPVVSQSTSC